MKRYKKTDILRMAAAMAKTNDSVLNAVFTEPHNLTEALIECQNTALQIGTGMEAMGNQYAAIVNILEDYCENIYQMSVRASDKKECRKLAKVIRRQLADIQNRIKYEMPEDRKEVVFLPYKAAMWDSLESVWKAADADEHTDAYVIPIPYFDRNPDGSFREEHYEGNLYPKYVPITKYDEYDFKGRRPDEIYIHNAYDDGNYVTSVHPFFYSGNLKKYTERLIYIPYFVLGEIKPDDKAAVDGMKHLCMASGVFNADKVIVQSEGMRQIYISVLTEETAKYDNTKTQKEIRSYWENKIDGSGSPKLDKILNIKKEKLEIPSEWRRNIVNPDGTCKKVIFYNTSISALLQYNEKMLQKMEDVFRIFYENKDTAALLWRPHPLTESTLISMRPQLWERYEKIKNRYRAEGWGIYDDTPDIDRAVLLCDGYYGDVSSVVKMCETAGKPIMIQNPEIITID